MDQEAVAPEVVAQYLTIAASILTIVVMVGGAVRVVRATGTSISGWAADKWSAIGRAAAAVSAVLVLAAVLGLTAANAALRARVNALEDALPGTPGPEGAVAELQDRFDRLIGRQWYDVTTFRGDDQCYVNNTDYPLEVAISTDAQSRSQNFCQIDIFVEEEPILQQINNNASAAKHCAATATVPPGARYRVNDDGHRAGRILMWWELRVGDTIDDLRGARCN